LLKLFNSFKQESQNWNCKTREKCQALQNESRKCESLTEIQKKHARKSKQWHRGRRIKAIGLT
jgi:hypothetical protein